jgi:hypothetical protein
VIGVSAEESIPADRKNVLIRNIIIAVIIAGIAVGVVFLIVGALGPAPITTTHSG